MLIILKSTMKLMVVDHPRMKKGMWWTDLILVEEVVPCVLLCHHRCRLIWTMMLMQVLMLMPKPTLITMTTLACLLSTVVEVLMLVDLWCWEWCHSLCRPS
jgi:hypothetical protein